MSRTTKILYKTEIHQGKGELPSRMCLVSHTLNGKVHEYSVHMQAKYESGWGFYGGNYYRENDYGSLRAALIAAKKGFNERIKKYPEFRWQGIKVR